MTWRIACHPNSYGRFGVPAALEHLAGVGIHWLELPIKTANVASPLGDTPVLTDQSTGTDVRRVDEAVRSSGLQLCSCNITSGNPLTESSLRATLTKLRIAADLGVSLVVGGGGEFTQAPDEPILIQNLRAIGDLAAELGMTYCCETHPGTCQNAASMLHWLARVDHPQICLNFDTANILFYNQELDVLSELRKVLPFVRHMHLKDSRGVFREWYFPALGEGGAVDFGLLRQLLAESGYSGPLSLEIEGFQNEGDTALTVYHQRVAASVEFLARCGYAGC